MQESVPARSSRPVTLFVHTAMGILDDAIREHLELIRSHGAADSEVRRLEDEAFGPPTRPDEADFPESEEAQAAAGNGVATEAPVDEPGLEEPVAHEDVTTLLPAEQRGEQPGAAEEGVEETEASEGVGDEAPAPEAESIAVEPEEHEPAPVPDEPVAEEPVAEEHPVVDEAGTELQEEPSDEMAMPAEEGTTLYDRSHDEELDIDLDLRLDDEQQAAEESPPEEDGIAEPEGTRPLEPPVESLDTVEHPFPEEIVESEEPHDEESPSDEHAVQEEAAAPEDEREGDEGDEDVLADTPEFLKDRPEDDELWFEQGEPKDFEF
jgi:hypothetical protein